MIAFSDMTKAKTFEVERLAYVDPITEGNNYNYFKKRITDSGINTPQLYEAMNHFVMVYIELTNDPGDENPQIIFESLNSTGLDLQSSDKVRNYVASDVIVHNCIYAIA